MFLLFRDFTAEPPANLPLSSEEIKHVKARRLAPGAPVYFGDGRGRRWAGRLAAKGRWQRDDGAPAVFQIEPPRLLCTALPEGRRWDWLLQKATELGVTGIQPVNFRRSVRREINPARAAAVVVEAAGQSQRFYLPEIREPITLRQLIEEDLPAERTYWLHYDPARAAGGAGTGPAPAANAAVGQQDAAAIVVGPEGGFENEEVDRLRARPGLREIQLGARILRVETAAIAMLARLL